MKDYRFFVRDNRRIAEDTWQMQLICWDATFFEEVRPGQFLHISLPNATHLLLRRPISIHSVEKDAHMVTLVYAIRGEGTRAMALLEKGTEVSVLGPAGNGFPIGEHSGEIWLLGGGIGVAPLLTVVQAAGERPVRAYLGWRSAPQVYGVESFERAGCEVKCFTDDGTFGEKGFAANALLEDLREHRPAAVFACGPMPMFRALAPNMPEDVPCYLSLEERMGCGVGACLVCSCKIKARNEKGWTYKRVCVDGPVFPLEEVLFE